MMEMKPPTPIKQQDKPKTEEPTVVKEGDSIINPENKKRATP